MSSDIERTIQISDEIILSHEEKLVLDYITQQGPVRGKKIFSHFRGIIAKKRPVSRALSYLREQGLIVRDVDLLDSRTVIFSIGGIYNEH